ncbi:hypothetical protein K474DRAFT_1079635 [Panus rudis PR-1116 ss-1]|nr:hypothetical protein K474DRAFT_1079635 [Panus rudis PR-1116 ss-1]
MILNSRSGWQHGSEEFGGIIVVSEDVGIVMTEFRDRSIEVRVVEFTERRERGGDVVGRSFVRWIVVGGSDVAGFGRLSDGFGSVITELGLCGTFNSERSGGSGGSWHARRNHHGRRRGQRGIVDIHRRVDPRAGLQPLGRSQHHRCLFLHLDNSFLRSLNLNNALFPSSCRSARGPCRMTFLIRLANSLEVSGRPVSAGAGFARGARIRLGCSRGVGGAVELNGAARAEFGTFRGRPPSPRGVEVVGLCGGGACTAAGCLRGRSRIAIASSPTRMGAAMRADSSCERNGSLSSCSVYSEGARTVPGASNE